MLWDGGEPGQERTHGMGSYAKGCRCESCRSANADYTVRRSVERKLERLSGEDAEEWEIALERQALTVEALERRLEKRRKQ